MATDNPADFSVQPQLPANQKKGVTGYYDLLLKPNQQQNLTFTIYNNATHASDYDVQVNPALTADGGAIDYSHATAKIDKTVPFDLRQYLTVVNKHVTVPAKQSAKVTVAVKMGAQTWSGRVMGGIYIQKAVTNSASSQGALQAKVAYALAVVLQQDELKLMPNLSYVGLAQKQVEQDPQLQLSFRNPVATIIPKLVFSTTIKKNNRVIFETTSNTYTVAPNTLFHVNIDLANHALPVGKYTVNINAKSGTTYQWHFTDDFQINKAITETASKDIDPPTKAFNWWPVILGSIVILGGGLTWWYRHGKQVQQ
ncbi:DUF916 domain-containing protein [Lacticaseibacillus saniviri]